MPSGFGIRTSLSRRTSRIRLSKKLRFESIWRELLARGKQFCRTLLPPSLQQRLKALPRAIAGYMRSSLMVIECFAAWKAEEFDYFRVIVESGPRNFPISRGHWQIYR